MKIKLPRVMKMLGFKLRKYAPEILCVSGVGAVVAGTVLACKATLKVPDEMDILEQAVDDIQNDDELTSEQKDEACKKVKLASCLRVAKLYAIPAAVEISGIGLIFGSNAIHRKRAGVAAATIAAIQSSYAAYRKRTAEYIGEDKEKEIRYSAEEVETTVEVDGKKKKQKNAIISEAGLSKYSIYARCFDESCESWDSAPGYNLAYVKDIEDKWNVELRMRSHGGTKLGVVFLNEVYDDLGIPRTDIGQIAGWSFDPMVEKQQGDGYIDFHIFDLNNERNRAFVNGYEPNIFLDFNCEGDVLHKLGKKRGEKKVAIR